MLNVIVINWDCILRSGVLAFVLVGIYLIGLTPKDIYLILIKACECSINNLDLCNNSEQLRPITDYLSKLSEKYLRRTKHKVAKTDSLYQIDKYFNMYHLSQLKTSC